MQQVAAAELHEVIVLLENDSAAGPSDGDLLAVGRGAPHLGVASTVKLERERERERERREREE